jgi:hypothetical protein
MSNLERDNHAQPVKTCSGNTLRKFPIVREIHVAGNTCRSLTLQDFIYPPLHKVYVHEQLKRLVSVSRLSPAAADMCRLDRSKVALQRTGGEIAIIIWRILEISSKGSRHTGRGAFCWVRKDGRRNSTTRISSAMSCQAHEQTARSRLFEGRAYDERREAMRSSQKDTMGDVALPPPLKPLRRERCCD